MKQISSWIAAMTVAFWGMMAVVASLHEVTPETRRAITTFVLPPLVAFTGASIAFFLRRKVRARRNVMTLEEVRLQSRQHMAGEPEDVHYVVRETNDRRQTAECCCKEADLPDRTSEEAQTAPPSDATPLENKRLEP